MARWREFPPATELRTERLTLEPLQVGHAEEMSSLLDDERLHAFIGGQPATLEELRSRYERQVVGHDRERSQGWCNWVVRSRASGAAVGTVQATLTNEQDRSCAELAWVVGTAYQRRGYAREAGGAVLGWLGGFELDVVRAHIRPEHGASQVVARALGLAPTEVVVDGETRWQGQPRQP